jgi:hypothetical protein
MLVCQKGNNTLLLEQKIYGALTRSVKLKAMEETEQNNDGRPFCAVSSVKS